jgi:hypothetical protein
VAASAASLPNDFCTGDPCVISSNKTIDNGAIVDFGTRAVIVQAELSVGTGTATINAGSFSIPHPGKLRGQGTTSTSGGTLTINVVNDIAINSTAVGGAVNFNGQSGGTLFLTSTTGSVTGAGKIFLENLVTQGSGGALIITVAQNINLTNDISVKGGSLADGGTVSVAADGAVTMTGTINANGGGGGGGFVDVSSVGPVTLGPIDADGGGDGGDGGGVDITASGDVRLAGRVNVRGGQNNDICGDGGSLEVFTDGDITVEGVVKVTGPAPDCCGNLITLDGRNVVARDNLDASGLGEFSCGGAIEIFATETFLLTGQINANGGDGGAGELVISAEGNVDIQGFVNVRTANPFGFGAAGFEIESLGGRLTVAKTLDASGGASGFGGEIDLTACDLVVQPGLTLRSVGDFGTIVLIASDSLSLAGTVTAGSTNGAIDVLYGTKASPPMITASFNIPPNIALTPSLLPCVCNLDAQCNDGNVCTTDACVATTCQNTATPPGGACEDGNGCTLGDTCSAGRCIAGGPKNCSDGIVCTQDVCTPATGACSNPPRPAGFACSDANACTQTDQCNGLGTCVGSNPVICTAAGQCHDPGTCNPGTGICSASLPKPSGAACNDTNACTQTDQCNGLGTCVGSNPVICSALSQCHDVGTCNPGSGTCSNPPRASGSPCDDANACTQTDECNGLGTCVGSNPVICLPLNQCYQPRTCDPGTGNCSPDVPKPSTAVCDDGDACTRTDRCDGAGSCNGTNPVVCTPLDQCHIAGTCDPGSGLCDDPPQNQGEPCDDANPCTENDACDAGICQGAPIPGCADTDQDGIRDAEDECTTIAWTSSPPSPPNQHPEKFILRLTRLSDVPGQQIILAKGFFNPAASLLPIDPSTNGVHLLVHELGGSPTATGGVLYEVNIPGGLLGTSPCDPRDGWKTIVRGTKTFWKYVNKSGALAPACIPGSARGVSIVFIKDLRTTRRLAYQFLVRAKNTGLDLPPAVPLRRLQMSLALGAQPAPGTASPQARAGQCAESVLLGSPFIRTKLPLPFCRTVVRTDGLATISCKGR